MNAVRRTILQIEFLLTSFGVAVFIFFLFTAEPLLRWTAGPEFVAAAPLLIVQTVAVTMTLTGTALRSALLAMGRQREVLAIVLVATTAFHVTALLLIPLVGAMGANIAHVLLGTLWAVGLTVAFRRALRRNGKATAPSSSMADMEKDTDL